VVAESRPPLKSTTARGRFTGREIY